MPTLRLFSPSAAAIMTSSVSPRRSSRLGDGDDSDSLNPNFGLSKDETAFSVLRTHVLEDDFKSVPDPDNIMKKIWIRNGMKKEDGGDGVDWIKEDGFTVRKYEDFWCKEMDELEHIIVEWGHKLPAEAKSHLDKSLFKKDDVEKKKVVEISPGPVPVITGERKSVTANSNKAPGKRKRQNKKKADSDDEADGFTPELLALREQWFRQLESGQYKVGVEEAKKTTSRKKLKAQAESTKSLFLHNVAGCPKVAQFKQVALDPLARHIISKIDAHVATRATALRNELLEGLALTNYKFTEVDNSNEADSELAGS